MPAWLIWLVVAAGLAAAESLSLDFVLIMCAGGAGAGAVAAGFGASLAIQLAVALVVAALLLLLVRPVARRHMSAGPTHRSGTDRLIGKQAVASTEVGPTSGLVRLNGADWSARSIGEGHTYPAGTTLRVLEISGATAVVYEEVS